ncbi:hypothetical protein [Granulosicoccus antarcticus]|uniref:Peptidase M50 n=1 Tax=Granulosicoccus antarcticus IMCC3135 TaxID=1192854 RepID=A0A2Z2NI08_9GAMM|nr:hypothetical protein [Granulosicoccus antarcticus]ASJ70946.1 hypothetical protein IMCC3135_04165 [Granulosicoccus antarcticus IMCC3135]
MSFDSLFSEHWYRVKNLTPVLADDVQVSRHVYRLQPSYVLRRASTRSWHRIDTSGYELLDRFNGRRTVQEVWEASLAQQNDNAASQADLINLLSQLHDADLLVVDARLDTEQLLGRRDRLQGADKRQRYGNPLFLRMRLMDPDSIVSRIDRSIPRHCFRALATVTIAIWLLALFMLMPRWAELGLQIADNQLFDPLNILLVGAIYPVLKLLHELAHALVVKRYGGDVREFGVALLVLVPNPYVDASAASMFADKHQRMLVSAAGILVEVTLAALATFVWLNSTGLMQSVALSVMLIGFASTLLFNGNPLLKFDGYFLLADWLEIPNLAAKSRQYLLANLARMTGSKVASEVLLADEREKYWLLAYGILSSIYRIALMFVIAWVLSSQYFFFGGLLAVYVCITSMVLPLWKAIGFVGNQEGKVRQRIMISGALVFCLFSAATVALPLPKVTVTDGIVWLPEQAVLRVVQGCEVETLHVAPGSLVAIGEPLFDCVATEWSAEVRMLEADLIKIDAQRAGLLITDPARHQRLVSERTSIQSSYELALNRLSLRQVVAASTGQFLVEGRTDLQGRYLQANSVAGFVVPRDSRTIRLALTQAEASWMDRVEQKIEVQFDNGLASRQVFASRITRKTPQASQQVASAALTTLGGGKLPAETGQDDVMVREPVFDIELAWPDTAIGQAIGTRVKVRFDQGSATLLERFMVFARHVLITRQTA